MGIAVNINTKIMMYFEKLKMDSQQNIMRNYGKNISKKKVRTKWEIQTKISVMK